MAEIHVQAKKGGSSAWLWILISILVIAALAFFFIRNNNNAEKNGANKPGSTSYIQHPLLPAA